MLSTHRMNAHHHSPLLWQGLPDPRHVDATYESGHISISQLRQENGDQWNDHPSKKLRKEWSLNQSI